MRWIIPAVVLAITALIIFQVNWLMKEAKMKEMDGKRRIMEAVHIACDKFGKLEARGFIGNKLDSVFVQQHKPQHDSVRVEVFDDSNRQVIIINDSVIHAQHPAGPGSHGPIPVPPAPPIPPQPGHSQFETPLPPPPPIHDSAIVIMREEHMKSAMEDVMMQYVFHSGDPMQPMHPHLLDSLLRVSFAEKGISYPFTMHIIHGSPQERMRADADFKLMHDTSWIFRRPVFPGDPSPFRPELLVAVDPGNTSAVSRIIPQILFAFFITLGMLVLFILIYREALKQKKIGDIRRDFINNMTHEFKTPLATMSLAADTIMNEKIIGDKDKVKYYAEQIKNENRKLNQQVEKVLELSLTEKNGIAMNKEEVNVIGLIKNAVQSMKLQVEARGGEISIEGDLSEQKIIADPFHLERVFLNLIDNAMKYGGNPPYIKIAVEKYRSGIQVLVSDNGKGIPHDEWETIFEPFHRVSTGDIHNVKGFGLGLSYAKSVVKEHNGSLAVTKSNISGTTFTLVLMHS